jgi:hypothetical protein
MEIGQGPNWGCSAKEIDITSHKIAISAVTAVRASNRTRVRLLSTLLSLSVVIIITRSVPVASWS